MGSEGAQLHSGLHIPKTYTNVYKGTQASLEAYSGFNNTLLNDLLQELKVKNVFIAGVAAEYCVHDTLIESKDLGYTTYYIRNCVGAIDAPGWMNFQRDMEQNGILFTNSWELIDHD
jgi:nicotinamidase/pyrazinamidase